MNKKVIVYTIDYCPYCNNAKALLSRKGISFEEIKLDRADTDKVMALYQKSGMRTFPQIFLEDSLIGGFDELVKFDKNKGLDNI
tara:strand:+ start:1321 stop:1572 length:252 start_codon:yes stop_codon:yes gene_type:complete